jgi:hypothetical protein
MVVESAYGLREAVVVGEDQDLAVRGSALEDAGQAVDCSRG